MQSGEPEAAPPQIDAESDSAVDPAIPDSVFCIPHSPSPVRRADCLSFLASLPDGSVDLIVTDPAYSGMNRHLMFGNGRIVGNYQSPTNERWFSEFHDDPETYRAFLGQCRRVLRDNRHLYIMFDSYSLLTLGGLVREFFDVKNVIVWDKVNLGMGHYFRRRHELIVFVDPEAVRRESG